jgi:hypothetical protein
MVSKTEATAGQAQVTHINWEAAVDRKRHVEMWVAFLSYHAGQNATYGTQHYELLGPWQLPKALIQRLHKRGGSCHPLQKCFFFKSFSIVLR